MTRIWIAALVLAFSAGTMTACKKKKEDKAETQAVAQDNAIAETSFDDLSGMADQASAGQASFQTYNSTCAELSYDTVGANVVVITIDFGPVNCVCADGKSRRGKIVITQTGHYYTTGSVTKVEPDNYFVNDYQLIGTRTVTNQGNYTFGIVVAGSVIKPASAGGGTITWNCTKTRTQTDGTGTPFILIDNVYSITGSANGTSATGVAFTINVDEALVVQIGCRWIKSGKLTITRSGKEDAKLDYGSGDCDNKAKLTIKNKTTDVTLSGW